MGIDSPTSEYKREITSFDLFCRGLPEIPPDSAKTPLEVEFLGTGLCIDVLIATKPSAPDLRAEWADERISSLLASGETLTSSGLPPPLRSARDLHSVTIDDR